MSCGAAGGGGGGGGGIGGSASIPNVHLVPNVIYSSADTDASANQAAHGSTTNTNNVYDAGNPPKTACSSSEWQQQRIWIHLSRCR